MEKVGMTVRYAMGVLKWTFDDSNRILRAYREPHRKYHNLEHLQKMLEHVPHNHPELHSLLEAILYHDFIYADKLVPSGLNEARSILAYGQHVGRGHNTERVCEAINATAYHDLDQPGLCELSKLVLDLDLESFAADRETFLRQSHSVKMEFEPHCESLEQFKEGNIAFLRKLLSRKQLYYIKTEWEQSARENLEWRMENFDVVPEGS